MYYKAISDSQSNPLKSAKEYKTSPKRVHTYTKLEREEVENVQKKKKKGLEGTQDRYYSREREKNLKAEQNQSNWSIG